MTSLSWQWGLEHRLVRFEFNFNNLLFHFNNLLVYFFIHMRLFVFLLSISIYRVFWNSLLSVDGGPLYVGRAEHEGGLFPGKVKSMFTYFLQQRFCCFIFLGVKSGANPSVCSYSALFQNPMSHHILHTWMFHHKFHTKMCHQIKHPKELLITCYTKGQPRP